MFLAKKKKSSKSMATSRVSSPTSFTVQTVRFYCFPQAISLIGFWAISPFSRWRFKTRLQLHKGEGRREEGGGRMDWVGGKSLDLGKPSAGHRHKRKSYIAVPGTWRTDFQLLILDSLSGTFQFTELAPPPPPPRPGGRVLGIL